jgi:hypothetical protein
LPQQSKEAGLAQTLFFIGAVPLILLGSMHLILTLKDISNPKIFAPRDPELLHRMQSEFAAITRDTTIWRSMLGFHISHSMAVLLVGVTVLYMAARYMPLLEADLIFRWAGPTLAWVFVVLAKCFWFRKPLIGAGISAGCWTAAAVLVSF